MRRGDQPQEKNFGTSGACDERNGLKEWGTIIRTKRGTQRGTQRFRFECPYNALRCRPYPAKLL